MCTGGEYASDYGCARNCCASDELRVIGGCREAANDRSRSGTDKTRRWMLRPRHRDGLQLPGGWDLLRRTSISHNTGDKQVSPTLSFGPSRSPPWRVQAQQQAPSGTVMRKNAQGQMHAVERTGTSMSGCIRGGQKLGRSASAAAQWCSNRLGSRATR
jgi:hypothetical protein